MGHLYVDSNSRRELINMWWRSTCYASGGSIDRNCRNTQLHAMTVNVDVSPTDGIPTVSDLDQ